MIVIRKSSERGVGQLDWLTSFHSFSFADYYDPNFMGFSHLRVINEDTIQPSGGFGRHPHQDMEIITYVIAGSLEHKDSMGTGSIIKPGEIQKMTAGSGIQHSEFNHSKTEVLHLLQIWILPLEKSLQPSYEQHVISRANNQLILIGSREGGKNMITIHQNVKLFVAYQIKDHIISYSFDKKHKGWLQLINGTIILNDKTLSSGDGAAITDESDIKMTCLADAEFLLFDFS